MLTIDGSEGEGGGQILRTSLALALVTLTPVRLFQIRKTRSRPGLMRQHLAALNAAVEVGRAEVTGAALGSTEVVFRPTAVCPGDYTFRVGSAGSAPLVLQTVLPALLRASAPSALTIEGGTHNPMAPPFDFLAKAYLPLLARMGARVAVEIDARGFYPAGGGRIRARIEPARELGRLDLLERGAMLSRSVVATVANLPTSIALRELRAAERVLGWERSCFRHEVIEGAPGPGNTLIITMEAEHVTEVVTGVGERSVRAEVVAERAAREAAAYLAAGVPVGEHLADQLLLPMALAGRGAFRTIPPSSHTVTHMRLLERLLGVRIRSEPIAGAEEAWHIEIGG